MSSCIQLYNIIKEYAYDSRNPFIRDRLIKCTDAILQATVPLRDSLHVVKAPAAATAAAADDDACSQVSDTSREKSHVFSSSIDDVKSASAAAAEASSAVADVDALSDSFVEKL